jgi:hypothetical protein
VKALDHGKRALARRRITPRQEIERVLRQPAHLVDIRRQDQVIVRQSNRLQAVLAAGAFAAAAV